MKGTSKTKFCKGTSIPKHSGNFSPIGMHWCSRTWSVMLVNGALVIGEDTPASAVLPQQLIWLMLNDPNFKSYEQRGTHTHNGKQYTCCRSVFKRFTSFAGFSLVEQIDTEGEFTYEFPEY